MLVTQQKSLRHFWYPVIPLERLTGGPKPFTLLGEKIVLFLGADGAPAALRDRCCHRTAQLSLGWCENGNIVCGYHGWTYDQTGRCVRIPQQDESTIPTNARTRAFHCATRYGYVWVALEDPYTPIPEFEQAGQEGVRQIDQFYERWECAGLRLMENSFDMSHIAFVHRETFGLREQEKPPLMKITPLEWGLETLVETPVKNHDENARTVTGSEGAETVRTMRGTWYMPFIRRLAISYPGGLKHDIITCATPIDDASIMVVQWCYRNDTEQQVAAAEVIAFDRAVTLEDKRILESTESDACIDTSRRVEFHMDTDRPGLVMRQKLLELFRRDGEEEMHGPSLAEV